MANTIRMRCSGREYVAVLDVSTWMGDTLETMESHLGEGVLGWADRLAVAAETGLRVRDLRSRDIIALIFLARSQAEPGVTWDEVARAIAPYTLELLDGEPVPAPQLPSGAPAHELFTPSQLYTNPEYAKPS
jgi:hypothetical protein